MTDARSEEASLLVASTTMVKRDLTLAMRRKADVLTTLFFFLIVPAVMLYPLGVSDSQTGMAFCLALIILANGAVVIS